MYVNSILAVKHTDKVDIFGLQVIFLHLLIKKKYLLYYFIISWNNNQHLNQAL